MESTMENMERTKKCGVINRLIFRSVLIFSIMLVSAFMISSFPITPAYAAEGGWSSYTPGTYGDFSMNYAKPGLYFRENVVYYKGKLDRYPVALEDPQLGPVPFNAKLNQRTWFNFLSITYVAKQKILGANYFITGNIPYGISSKLTLDIPDAGITQTEKAGFGDLGIGDIWIAPIGLMWNFGSFHITFTENIVLPTGEFSSDKMVNMGRNYTSFDTDLGFTWLDEKNGHEVSFIAGYLINKKNDDTDYKTGKEFHIDFALNQFLSEKFAVGIVGYYYKQLTSDSNPTLDGLNQLNAAYGLATYGGYKSNSAGVGPAIMIGLSKNVQIMGKWIWEYHTKNRFEGNWGQLSLVFKF
jgi:hypothetical protein